MKALEKDRRRRYESASEMASDIERFLHDEQVEACPPTIAYRLSKFVHRNRTPIGVTVLALVLLIAGAVSCVWLAVRARHAEISGPQKIEGER